jgi:hypothetical protein
VLTGVVRRAYKRGPLEACVSWGMLIEVVEKVEGMRGRRRWAVYGSRIDACVMEALVWGRRESTRDELESLILAQNERWRHA